MKTASYRLGGRRKTKRNLSKHITALICTGLLRFLSSWSPALKTQELPLIIRQLFHFQPQFFYHCPLTEFYLQQSLLRWPEDLLSSFYLSANTHTTVVPAAALLPASLLFPKRSSEQHWRRENFLRLQHVPPALAGWFPVPPRQSNSPLHLSWCDKEWNPSSIRSYQGNLCGVYHTDRCATAIYQQEKNRLTQELVSWSHASKLSRSALTERSLSETTRSSPCARSQHTKQKGSAMEFRWGPHSKEKAPHSAQAREA